MTDVFECSECEHLYELSDAEDFYKFCSSECQAAYRQGLEEYRTEEAEAEFLEEKKNITLKERYNDDN